MSGTCVIGLQWGDEAKGKIVDLLTRDFDIVVRYQGGANAGHTVVVAGQVYKLHHIPSGVLSPGVMNVIGPGVVLNPPIALQEIDSLASRGIDLTGCLQISDRLHVVFPWHIAEDKALNASPVGGESIGTTNRGIGPCYRDKYGRSHAIRLGDFYRPDFAQKVRSIAEAKQRLLAHLGSAELLDVERILEEYNGYAARLRPFVADTTNYLLDALDAGKRLLFEGAQGSLLDIDHGTFPFVTSSNSSGVGVSAGSGVPARWIKKVIGVAKGYTTRVGGGPFPTELTDEVGQRIRDLGHEYGTTTGRPRRCGWFDAVAVRVHRPTGRRRRAGDHDAGRAQSVAGDQAVRGVRIGRRTNRAIPQPHGGFAAREADLRGAARLAAGRARAQRIQDLPAGAATTWIACRNLSGGPSRLSRWDPAGNRRSLPKRSFARGDRNTFTMSAVLETKLATSDELGVPPERLPRHIAVIMDGNGRWAQSRHLPRIEGHRRGVASVRSTVEACAKLGIGQLTLYCLSSENWKRPQHELDFLMHLLEQYMIEERRTIMENNVVVDIIGRRDGIPLQVQQEIDRTISLSAGTPAPGCAWRSTMAGASRWWTRSGALPSAFATAS